MYTIILVIFIGFAIVTGTGCFLAQLLEVVKDETRWFSYRSFKKLTVDGKSRDEDAALVRFIPTC